MERKLEAHAESKENLDHARLENLYAYGMELNEWILACRQQANLTQQGLADMLSVTKANVSAWENGRHQPSYGQIVAIYRISGATLLPPGLSPPQPIAGAIGIQHVAGNVGQVVTGNVHNPTFTFDKSKK
ncbi:hypothetical protein JCM19000A_25640 [Silvimonas sp. JCM 19000]